VWPLPPRGAATRLDGRLGAFAHVAVIRIVANRAEVRRHAHVPILFIVRRPTSTDYCNDTVGSAI
jgi:hypothetical protein